MQDPESVVICGSSGREILTAYNKAIAELPPDVKLRLSSVLKNYLVAYGLEGVYERFNGRTVAQVFSEYREPVAPPVACAGEREGVRFTLHEARPLGRNTAEPEAAPEPGDISREA